MHARGNKRKRVDMRVTVIIRNNSAEDEELQNQVLAKEAMSLDLFF
jgi:hypothetical protein